MPQLCVQSHRLLMEAYVEIGAFEDAKSVANQALEIQPDFRDVDKAQKAEAEKTLIRDTLQGLPLAAAIQEMANHSATGRWDDADAAQARAVTLLERHGTPSNRHALASALNSGAVDLSKVWQSPRVAKASEKARLQRLTRGWLEQAAVLEPGDKTIETNLAAVRRAISGSA